MPSSALGTHSLAHLRIDKIPESHDPMVAIKLDRESNGYCPLCGYWSIITGMIIDSKTGEQGDVCQVCGTLFDVSELVFTDSQMCTCGHPRNFHDKTYLNCEKGHELQNCQCKKYRPTQVTIMPLHPKEE